MTGRMKGSLTTLLLEDPASKSPLFVQNTRYERVLLLLLLLALPPLTLRLKFFRKMVAACVPYDGQQVLPHSNLLDPHLRSQFADFFVYARRKAQFSCSAPFPWYPLWYFPRFNLPFLLITAQIALVNCCYELLCRAHALPLFTGDLHSHGAAPPSSHPSVFPFRLLFHRALDIYTYAMSQPLFLIRQERSTGPTWFHFSTLLNWLTENRFSVNRFAGSARRTGTS